MKIERKNLRISTYISFLCLLALTGCGVQQKTAAPTVELPPAVVVKTTEVADASLAKHEVVALNKKGQIDRDVPDEAMADIAIQYKYFLRKGRKTMCAFSKQSEQYLAYARQVFRERGMPEELANLAIVESGYRPTAVSKAGAAGAWQFMPFTGQKYGLTQDWWQDDRLDPYRATEAAADYLQKLYNDFGDWPTAIAAYNAGEGKMSRALLGTGGKDFFEVTSLNHTLDEKTQLREETKQYVPRFMAVTKIMRNLPELGFEPIEPDKQPGVKRLKVKPGTDLTAFSQACNLSWTEFKSYNLHHKRNITCSDRHTFVYVPSRAEKLATEYLTAAKPSTFADWKPMKVKSRNDSLEKISLRSNVPLALLRTANPGINKLANGQIILAPQTVNLSAKAVASVSTPARTKEKKTIGNQKTVAESSTKASAGHILQSKETLYAVAKKYNVSVQELMQHNNINNPGTLRIGQKLQIPGGTVASAPVKGGSRGKIGSRSKTTYTVQKKDNLWAIARKHRISVTDLKRWNQVDEKSLKPGAVLIVAEE